MSERQRRSATIFFLLGVGLVVAAFFVLGNLDTPQRLPLDQTHKLHFNLEGQVIALGIADTDKLTELKGARIDEKLSAQRISVQCVQCHGLPQGVHIFDESTQQNIYTDETHACHASQICLPAKHPPKEICIKCHRAAQQ